MVDLLEMIEREGIPAPAPIEQRWSSGSASWLSPAAGEGLFSWVGVIMYLPTDEPEQRAAITSAFEAYKGACEAELWPRYGCVEHWAKVEAPPSPLAAEAVRARLAGRFGVQLGAFAALRGVLDPRAILANELLDAVMPRAPPGGE